ncbi:MAG: ribosomal RNA small subunit methyltransferase G [Paracoccaceae bacterium]|nr:MAG: ribosomal RNA small subunit methyltransferase G [Paracoccaceae bacterium]
MTAGWDADRFRAAFDVSRETVAALEAYRTLLEKWNRRINLVSANSLPQFWQRHAADSAQLFGLAPGTARRWVDLGSGGGLPGLVVALLAREKRPDLEMVLVESDQRKAAFLRHAADRTGAPCTVRDCRIEEIAGETFDVISARALAPLPRLLALAQPLRAPGAVCLFPKGARHESELTEARRSWHIDLRTVPSITDPQSRILIIEEVQRVT